MIYFFHHYELPLILHQAHVQDLLMRNQQEGRGGPGHLQQATLRITTGVIPRGAGGPGGANNNGNVIRPPRMRGFSFAGFRFRFGVVFHNNNNNNNNINMVNNNNVNNNNALQPNLVVQEQPTEEQPLVVDGGPGPDLNDQVGHEGVLRNVQEQESLIDSVINNIIPDLDSANLHEDHDDHDQQPPRDPDVVSRELSEELQESRNLVRELEERSSELRNVMSELGEVSRTLRDTRDSNAHIETSEESENSRTSNSASQASEDCSNSSVRGDREQQTETRGESEMNAQGQQLLQQQDPSVSDSRVEHDDGITSGDRHM